MDNNKDKYKEILRNLINTVLILGIIIALAFGGYLFYKNQKEKNAAKKSLASHHFRVEDSSVNPCRLSAFVDEKDINRFVKEMPREGFVDFSEKKETLEDYFMSFYKEDKTYGGIKK